MCLPCQRPPRNGRIQLPLGGAMFVYHGIIDLTGIARADMKSCLRQTAGCTASSTDAMTVEFATHAARSISSRRSYDPSISYFSSTQTRIYTEPFPHRDNVHIKFYIAHDPSGQPPSCLMHCLAEGTIIPPTRRVQPLTCDGYRLQISKLLQRTRSVRSKANGLQSRLRRMATGSSLPQIKAPFSLKLTPTPRMSEEQSSTTLCSRELRRSGTSSEDLRGLARQHAVGPGTPLLPSPITHDSKHEEDSYFGLSDTRAANQTLNDAVLDKLQILSYYCNEEDSGSTTGGYLCCESATDDKASENDDSTASDSVPVTPIDQISHPFVCSDESGWLANTTSHDERQRRFKARVYQIVQHPCNQYDPEYADDQVVSTKSVFGDTRFNSHR